MAFVKYHQPCPLCGSSDAASINEDGSAYCFSCDKRVNDYTKLTQFELINKLDKLAVAMENPSVEDFIVKQTNSINEIEGSF